MALSRQEVRQMVWDEAKRQGVDPTLAVKLAWAESRFNPDARSKAGAISVMQLMPGTAKDLGVDPADVADNIRGGVTYLKQQLDTFGGDARLALAAYNAGPGNVRKYGGVPPFKETQNYVKTILGGAAPPDTMVAQAPPDRDWGQELGLTAHASAETSAEPGVRAQGTMSPSTGPSDGAAVVMGDGAPDVGGGQGQGQDWATVLFG